MMMMTNQPQDNIHQQSPQSIADYLAQLLKDRKQLAALPNVFFTLSFWENEEALNAYRDSELFKTTWAKTKILFSDKPQAWTTEVVSLAH